jgi:hypothetical protein
MVVAFICAALAASAQLASSSFDLQADRPGTLVFFGSELAELLSKEVNESYRGALKLNFVHSGEAKYPAGFLRASPVPQGWSDSFWTRDGGTFMRELTQWGYFKHACTVANCLMQFAGTNKEGYVVFPEYFHAGDVNKSGAEIDGHGAIIIAMAGLWQRLPANDAFRPCLYEYLHRRGSPVRYLHHTLESEPLIPGANEFGPGCGLPGLYYNVVQNHLCALALIIAADMEEQAGDRSTARLWRRDARKLQDNMEKYLVAEDGSWLWCIDPKTLKPDPAVINHPVNVGFGGLNGVACMYSDVLGFTPLASKSKGVTHSRKTFEKLYAFPLRRQQFAKYGIWTQFDVFHDGLNSSPAYGHGYALQTMLLYDKLDMAGRALDFLARATYKSEGMAFPRGRLSPYYFCEQLYSPDALGATPLSCGCGPLNLICVTEPVKAARLMLGVDDTSAEEVRIIPRIPPRWSGCRAENWPIRTSRGVVRADLSFEKKNGSAVLTIRLHGEQAIPKLAVRMPEGNGAAWKHKRNVTEWQVTSAFEKAAETGSGGEL